MHHMHQTQSSSVNPRCFSQPSDAPSLTSMALKERDFNTVHFTLAGHAKDVAGD
jgi:hypothetical protein